MIMVVILKKLLKTLVNLQKVEDTSSLIFAHEVALTSLLNSMPKFVRQYKQGLRTQEDMKLCSLC